MLLSEVEWSQQKEGWDMHFLARFPIYRVLAGVVVFLLPHLTYRQFATQGLPDLISSIQLVVMYVATGFGITIFFHRYFVHNSFRVVYQWLVYVGGILGSMTAQGQLSMWSAGHLEHHRHTDKGGDPHSPHRFGERWWAHCLGFLYAHFVWFLFEPAFPEAERLRKKDIVRRIDDLFVVSVIGGLAIPVLMGALVRWSFEHWYDDFMWGGVTRIMLVQHTTWCVNSVCHLWGKRPFRTGEWSTNNLVVAVLTLGEGNHNCHHKFHWSACHGLLPGQWDPSYRVILGLKKIGLVTDVRVPTPEQIQEALAA